MNLQETEAEVIEIVGRSITAVYDSIYPYYNERTADGIVLDVDWWLKQYPELDRKRLRDAMSKRKMQSLASDSDIPNKPSRDELAVKRAVRTNPQAVVEAINELPEADRKAIQAEVAQTLEPTKRALNAMKAVFAADVIEEAIELVRSADREHLPEIQAKCDELVLAVHERWILTEADSK